jgi:hypothetical protein
MDIKKLLQEAENEPAGVVVRSADGRLFFIPDADAGSMAIQDSNLYRAFLAAGGGTSPATPADSLYPCGLVKDWLDAHSPRTLKWKRICLEYFDNCV